MIRVLGGRGAMFGMDEQSGLDSGLNGWWAG